MVGPCSFIKWKILKQWFWFEASFYCMFVKSVRVTEGTSHPDVEKGLIPRSSRYDEGWGGTAALCACAYIQHWRRQGCAAQYQVWVAGDVRPVTDPHAMRSEVCPCSLYISLQPFKSTSPSTVQRRGEFNNSGAVF
jgi:hypothetical protein